MELLKRILLITTFLILIPLIVSAQFSYRFEVIVGEAFSSHYDKISVDGNYLDNIKNNRNGNATMLGVKYNLNKYPLSIYLGYEYSNLSDYSSNSNNIDVSYNTHAYKINSIDLNVQYLFFTKSSLKPFLLVGLNYNHINYLTTGLSYNFSDESNNEYIQIDDISWGENSVQTDLNALGYCLGAGFNFRLSDKIGINSNIKFNLIVQNQNEWFGNYIIGQTYNIGMYYRISKRKNNIF